MLNMNEKFVKCFIEAFKEMIDHDIEELILLYGNNEDKIFETLKNKYKDICEFQIKSRFDINLKRENDYG